MKNRIDYLDTAKGIGIYLIVVGHAYSYYQGNGNITLQYIYSFHVPLFFIISGVIYSIKSLGNKIDLLKKAQSFLIPYFVWGTIYQVSLMVLSVNNGSAIKDELASRTRQVLELSSGALWFLPTICVAITTFFITAKLGEKLHFICCICMFLIGALAPHSYAIMETLWRGLVGCGFVAIGYYARHIFTARPNRYAWLAVLMVDIVLININKTNDLARRNFGVVPIYIIVSIIGSWLVITFCHYWNKMNVADFIKTFLQRIGKYSIIVLCTHQIFIVILQLIDYKVFDSAIQKTGEFEGFIMASIVITVTYFLCPVIIKFGSRSFGIK